MWFYYYEYLAKKRIKNDFLSQIKRYQVWALFFDIQTSTNASIRIMSMNVTPKWYFLMGKLMSFLIL